MDGTAAHDPRVWAILKTPDEYFKRARRHALLKAREDVAADLARRSEQRQKHIFRALGRRKPGSTLS